MAVFFVLLIGARESRAQDSHYWRLQFGPRASLLGGAVIGSISDVSGTFYNPGALSVASDLSFALSLSVFERSSFRLEDGAGEGVDLGATRSGLRPSMVAGVIKRNLFGRGSVLAYSALSRAQGSHDLQAVSSLSGVEIPPDIDATHLVGLAEAIDLGDAVGVLPGTLVIYGIEIDRVEPGVALSPAIDSAADDVVESILDLCEGYVG